MQKTLDIIFPPKCFGCKVNYGYICYTCLQKCKIARYFYCAVCDKPAVRGETHVQCCREGTPADIFSAYEYKGLVRKCIMKAKYRAKLFASLKTLSLEAAHIASKCALDYREFVVTSIPLSAQRTKERGFNQAGIIAQAAAEVFSISYQDSILIRKKETKVQHKKTRQERFENLKEAFIVKQDVREKNILIVDDICTTGATLLEASRVLHQAGAKEIKCFTLAKEF